MAAAALLAFATVFPAAASAGTAPGSSIASAPALPVGVTQTVGLTSGDSGFYRVSLGLGDKLALDYSTLADQEVKVCILDPTVTDSTLGTSSCYLSDYTTTSGSDSFVAPKAGEWTVEFSAGYTDVTFSFDATIKRSTLTDSQGGSTIAAAPTLPVQGTYRSGLTNGGPEFYRVPLGVGGEFSVDYGSLSGQEVDVCILDPSVTDATLGQSTCVLSDGTSGSTIDLFAVPKTGNWIIEFRPYYSWDSVAFSFKAAATYDLTVDNNSENGSGTVTSSPAGIDCGSTCDQTYAPGTRVTLTATRGTDSFFVGWSGACSGTGSSCTVTMDQARRVTATFRVPTLTVTSSGTGDDGGITSQPAGISCASGETCSHYFDYGTQVTLTAAASLDTTFNGWAGACSGTGSSCTVTMDEDRSVSASFTGYRTLTVRRSRTGSGTVTSQPAGITCGSTCSKSFAYGTQVTLTATPASGSTFAGWSGGACSGTGTCTVRMRRAKNGDVTAPKIVIATFTTKTKPGACVVPNVVGKTVAAAKRALKAGHCGVGKIKRLASSARKGRVIAQKPSAGRHLKKGAKVSLTVSKGKRH